MINLRTIAASAVAVINPPTVGSINVSTGYTTLPDGSRQPTYQLSTGIVMDVQALTERDILHVDALNIAGSTHVVFISGVVDGLVREENKGGDLIYFNNQTWLVTGVLEQWPGWCKVAVTLQADTPPV